MANPLEYSRNTDFTSLVDPPNTPQISTLQQEIADSACVAVVDHINTNEVPVDDIQVLIYFETEPDSADEAVVNGVVAAHEGRPTTGNYQGKKSVAESTNATTTLADKVDATAKPVKAGLYQLGASCEIKLGTGISSLPGDRAVEVVVELNGTEQAFCRWPFGDYHDFVSIAVVTFDEGDTPNLKMRFRRVGVSDTAYIRRARVWLVRLSNGEEAE